MVSHSSSSHAIPGDLVSKHLNWDINACDVLLACYLKHKTEWNEKFQIHLLLEKENESNEKKYIDAGDEFVLSQYQKVYACSWKSSFLFWLSP